MFRGRLTHAIVSSLDWLAQRTLPADRLPEHQRTGRRGEEAAYFHLRKLGYTMVERNYRSPKLRGEIDLIGWDADVLCFIEVKTRTSAEIKPAEAAVDRHKRREIQRMINEYLRRSQMLGQWRFDIVSVYYESSRTKRAARGQPADGKSRNASGKPQIEIFRNASLTS